MLLQLLRIVQPLGHLTGCLLATGGTHADVGLCSCNGGCLCLSVVHAWGSLVPVLAFTTRREVQKADEPTYAYGKPKDGTVDGFHEHCLFGTAQCLGDVPSQQSRD